MDGRNRLRDSSMNEIINIVFTDPAALVQDFIYMYKLKIKSSLQFQKLKLNASFHVNSTIKIWINR